MKSPERETLDQITEIIDKHKQREVQELRDKMNKAASEGIGLANKYFIDLPHEVYDFLYGLPRE